MLEYSIGREDCDIVLESDAVSRTHAMLIFARDGVVTVRDTQSRNGSFLVLPGGSEARIGTAPTEVHLDNVLRFGDERLRVSELIIQLLQRRHAARRALAENWGGPQADQMFDRIGGRRQTPPPPPKDLPGDRKLRIDPETGRLVHD